MKAGNSVDTGTRKKEAGEGEVQRPGELDSLQRQLAVERKREKELMAKISLAEDDLAKISQDFSEAWQERQDLEGRYLKIKQSRTWQATRPLRKLLSLLKRILRGKSQHKVGKGSAKVKKKKELKAKKQIAKTRYRLLNLGFTERALRTLKTWAADDSHAYRQRLAAWELALWYANQYNPEDARKSLDLLPLVAKGKENAPVPGEISIIEAECQEILGDMEAARLALQRGEMEETADLCLAAANLQASLPERIFQVNKALALGGLAPISYEDSPEHPPFDNVRGAGSAGSQLPSVQEKPKVTIIMPAYNSAEVIATALNSLLHQTWPHVEIIVVDDGSTDATVQIVSEYARREPGILLIQAESNQGPYVARNLALNAASGEFVTCHDADDWSHPEKVSLQVLHLLENPSAMGNTTLQARATSDMKFHRRGKPGYYIFNNISSFMFRREPVMQAVGYWDSVRFGADGEFLRRIRLVLGEDSVVHLPIGPLAFQRQSHQSLTGNESFGFHGYFMGARKEYYDSYLHFYSQNPNLRYSFPQDSRPFAIPEPMGPVREKKASPRRHFDVILVSEFRLTGGTVSSNAEEIKAQKRMGLRTGLIQMSRYVLDVESSTNAKIRELMDGDSVQMLVYGEKVSCDVLILRHPPILHDWQRFIPDVEAKAIRVIINQPPMRDYGPRGVLMYELKRSAEHLRKYFGKDGIWYPIGPLVREALEEHHREELPAISLAEEDWVNIIDVDEWRRPSRPTPGPAPKIGRHSRSQYVKWPSDPKELLAVYPDSPEYEVHVLGGAEVPREVLGYLPKNWHVFEFGEMHPRDFLATLDVFVYYTHPDWVESFGRVIIETMAVGVPVILPHSYETLFKEAAIYAKPAEVPWKIAELMKDPQYYDTQVERARRYVETNFGYTRHALRLGDIMDRKLEVAAAPKV